MWRRNWPSYNLPMREARLAFACLATASLLGACGQQTAGARPGLGGEAGSALGGAAGSAAAGGVGAAGVGAAGAGAAGSGGVGMAGECMLGAAGASAGAAPVGTDLGELTVDSIAIWKDDAKGAYTIIHDDICDWPIDSLFDVAEPELTQRGLSSAFGAIVTRCVERKLWPKLEVMRQHGHEIINHTWDHHDIVTEADKAPLALEMDQANQVLNDNLVGQHTSFFIFPYDSFDDAAVEHLSTLGYLGARAGKKGVNSADFPDGMRVMFDVWGGENSIYDGQGDILKIYVDLAIAQGGWSVREFHGIADTTFFAMNLDDYRAHLDYVKSKVDSGELWVDTPSTVLRYRFSRQYCGTPSASGYQLSFEAPSCDCARYATPLSVIVTTAVDAPSAVAAQAGKMLQTKKLGPNRFVVDAEPLGGPIAVGGGS
jgi:peptidoglycan/xylan/chitin deacetylase (PgdA/CDA1 family)